MRIRQWIDYGIQQLAHYLYLKGHWIISVFPQCEGDLMLLADSQFPLYEVPSESITSDQGLGACEACVPSD